MFRLRSIRRKLVLSLALVMAMLLVQGAAGLSGLMSYRSVIRDLERMFSAGPRRSDVVAAIGLAFEPLLWRPATTVEGRRLTQQHAQKRLEDLRATLNDFHRRLDGEAIAPDQRLVAITLLNRVDDELALMLKTEVPRLGTDEHQVAAGILRDKLAGMQLTLLNIPRIEHGLDGQIEAARGVYKSRFWWICGSMAAAVVLFGLLIHCGYRWVFVPVRRLHQGASRVAQGDFGFRVQVSGTDEMAELADKFNQMTARFEEIRDRLDREVRERTKQALRSERLAGVGFLAAGVAHEINNPLSAIAMAAESLESRLSAVDDDGFCPDDRAVLRQYLGMIQREAFRCQQITQRLLDFSRGQDAPRSRQDIVRIIGEVLDMVGHMTRFRGHEIVFDRQTPVFAEVSPSEIKQVVLNLVANALESMEGKGRLEIRAVERSDEVILSFQDNGCGMTPHVLENLFEPFFTEKKGGRGTGLGLSISHRIVSDHGGRIEVSSDGPGQGSLFQVHLPKRPARRQAA
uniref:histidine kinase n=1 Tax=Schlesneria paludicola TaxID=360056 RepID=A0A7C2K293_9PLAN